MGLTSRHLPGGHLLRFRLREPDNLGPSPVGTRFAVHPSCPGARWSSALPQSRGIQNRGTILPRRWKRNTIPRARRRGESRGRGDRFRSRNKLDALRPGAPGQPGARNPMPHGLSSRPTRRDPTVLKGFLAPLKMTPPKGSRGSPGIYLMPRGRPTADGKLLKAPEDTKIPPAQGGGARRDRLFRAACTLLAAERGCDPWPKSSSTQSRSA